MGLQAIAEPLQQTRGRTSQAEAAARGRARPFSPAAPRLSREAAKRAREQLAADRAREEEEFRQRVQERREAFYAEQERLESVRKEREAARAEEAKQKEEESLERVGEFKALKHDLKVFFANWKAENGRSLLKGDYPSLGEPFNAKIERFRELKELLGK